MIIRISITLVDYRIIMLHNYKDDHDMASRAYIISMYYTHLGMYILYVCVCVCINLRYNIRYIVKGIILDSSPFEKKILSPVSFLTTSIFIYYVI